MEIVIPFSSFFSIGDTIITIEQYDKENPSLTLPALCDFLFTHLEKYGDSLEDITRAVDYATSRHPCKGGSIYLARKGDELVGALVMLRMPTSGFVPDNLLVYIAVDAAIRGEGIGGTLMQYAIKDTEGDIALHVDMDNPARRLYERMGFTADYIEMRYKKG